MGGLIIGLFLSFVSYLIDGGELIAIFQRMQGFLFIAIVTISLGILASEINFFIKSNIFSSALFGVLSPLVFVGLLLLDSFIFSGTIKSMPIEFYLTIYTLFSFLLGALFFGTLRKTPNKKIN